MTQPQPPYDPRFQPPPGQPTGYAGVAPTMPYQPASVTHDADHLRLLSIFHYVYGPIVILFSSMFIIHIIMGAMLLGETRMPSPNGQQMPAEFGWMFIIMGTVIVLLGWTLGICTIIAGRMIARRRGRVFTLIIAGINCASVPLGTALGVFTFIVLLRDSVRQMYEASAADGRREREPGR